MNLNVFHQSVVCFGGQFDCVPITMCVAMDMQACSPAKDSLKMIPVEPQIVYILRIQAWWGYSNI